MSPAGEGLNLALRDSVDAIQRELSRILEEARHKAFLRHGGLIDTPLDHERMIREIGPRRAAQMTSRFIQLSRELRRLYLLRPGLALEHIELLRELNRRGWIRRPAGEP